jgi:hypothetical protein
VRADERSPAGYKYLSIRPDDALHDFLPRILL